MSVFKKTTECLSGKKKAVQQNKGPDIPLQAYLDKYYKEAIAAHSLGTQPDDDSDPKLHVPISIFAHAKTGGGFHYAGVHDEEMHFSASLMKAAAMYAAFSLRAEARTLAASKSFDNATAFFDALKKEFKSSEADPAIRKLGIGLQPRYTDILTVTGSGKLTVKFVPAFHRPIDEDNALFEEYKAVRVAEHLGEDADGNPIENAKSLAAFAKISHMWRMIVPSNNESAGECIRRLGYGYINVKLMQRGFFEPNLTPPRGIWLAADFVGGKRVEIESLNDGPSAQATTSLQIARLFSLIDLEELIDAGSSNEMRLLLNKSGRVDPAWLSRPPEDRRFSFVGVKVGVANLKPNDPPKGPDVFSEGLLLKWKDEGDDARNRTQRNVSGELAVCWQNVRKVRGVSSNPKFRAIAEMIEKSFSDFLEQAPI